MSAIVLNPVPATSRAEATKEGSVGKGFESVDNYGGCFEMDRGDLLKGKRGDADGLPNALPRLKAAFGTLLKAFAVP